MKKSTSGFTIVELLIVIVVIAILATISIVVFNGVQQRAKNTKTISAVRQVITAVEGYIAANGTYPVVGLGTSCLVPSESTCMVGGASYEADTYLMDGLKTISSLPVSIPTANADYTGIVYQDNTGIIFNGKVQRVRLFYSLLGVNQQCGVENVTDTGGGTMVSSTTGYTGSWDGATTVCVVSVSGP